MEIYKIPIEFAFIIFPFVAFLFTLPFLIYEYHKYGSIPFLKSFFFYSFILYLLTAYFMVIMPLPTIEEVANYRGKTTQLIPFQFISDIKSSINIPIKDFSSFLSVLNNATVYTVLFNLLLTLPFGIYLRYFFNRKLSQIIGYTFLLSLFFELTQLSGLYGIYPRAYRLFDIDDLIINTVGGLVGYIITPLFVFLLPTKEELNHIGYIKGQKVRFLRRSVALLIDLVFLSIFSFLLKIILYNTNYYQYHFILAIILYYLIIPILNNTKTFGKDLVKLEIIGIKNNDVKIYQLLLRNFLLSFIILFPFSWLALIKDSIPSNAYYITIFLLAIIELANIFFYYVPIYKENLFLYEIISRTKNKSSISYIIDNANQKLNGPNNQLLNQDYKTND